MAKQLKMAIIGVGALGKHHARILSSLPNVEFVGVCEIDKKLGKQVASDYNTQYFANYEELESLVDAVTIATPTHLHYKIAKFFLTKEVHTLIEKPITLDIKEADELIELAKEKNLSLQVGHIERHNAAFKRVEKLANKIKFIEIHRLGPFTPRVKDMGVILDLMIHDFDIVQSLVKQEIEYLDAVGINVLTQHEDIANVRIKFKNGTIANITASRLTPERQRKIRIFQNDSYISLDYQNQEVKIYRKSLLGLKKEFLEIEKEEPLYKEVENYVNGILNNTSPGKPDIEARDALALANQCLEIIKTNNERFRRNDE